MPPGGMGRRTSRSSTRFAPLALTPRHSTIRLQRTPSKSSQPKEYVMRTQRNGVIALAVVAVLLTRPAVFAQHEHVLLNEQDIKWEDAPPFIPPGAKAAVLQGNPSEKGLFTIRLKLPANYRVPAHWHPTDEHVSVFSGALYMGMGD